MPLYRATYVRAGRPLGTTFSATSNEAALRFWNWWQERAMEWSPGDQMLTLRKVRSRFDNKGRLRSD